MEGKITRELLGGTLQLCKNVFAIQGPGGVGKTTSMSILTHEQRIRKYFSHGIYQIKLGADTKTEAVIQQLVDIARKSGGVNNSSQTRNLQRIDDVMNVVAEWFRDKNTFYLLIMYKSKLSWEPPW